MKQKKTQVSISDFKARALRMVADVDRTGQELTILKNGRPIARVVPIQTNTKPLKGYLQGKAQIVGDIVDFNTSEDWEVNK